MRIITYVEIYFEGSRCVRLAETLAGSVAYTVNKSDFAVYRKNDRQPVPCIFPD